MSRCVAEHQCARAAVDRRGVELLHRFRIAARGVFGRVHHLEAQRHRIFDSMFGGAEQKIAVPALGVAPNGAGSQERGDLNRKPRLLHDLGDGTNVVFDRARGAISRDLHLVRYDFARQRGDVFYRARARSRQAEVERVDAERLHQVQDFDFLFDRWIAHGWRLQTVAQGFVGQAHRSRRMQGLRVKSVPIVDQFRSIHS